MGLIVDNLIVIKPQLQYLQQHQKIDRSNHEIQVTQLTKKYVTLVQKVVT